MQSPIAGLYARQASFSLSCWCPQSSARHKVFLLMWVKQACYLPISYVLKIIFISSSYNTVTETRVPMFGVHAPKWGHMYMGGVQCARVCSANTTNLLRQDRKKSKLHMANWGVV